MDRHTGRDHQRRKGQALRPPSTPPTINNTRVATPCPPRGRTDTNREEPDLQGVSRGGSNPQQPSTNADTVLHVGEPPLHLGYETGSYVSTIEVANHHKPPPTCTGHSIRQPNPSPALRPGKVGPQHRRPVTGHRRPCRRQPGCRQRPHRSEKPTSAFSTTRLTARRRRPPHPTVRRRPQHHRRSRAVGHRHNEQRRQGPPLQCAAHRSLSSPHRKPPPANEVPAGQKAPRAGRAAASPSRARRRTGTQPTSKRRRSSCMRRCMSLRKKGWTECSQNRF
jgi:hypothetical protein